MKNNSTRPQADLSYAAFIGLDWSSTEHVFCLFDPQTAKHTHRSVPNKPEALLEFFAELRAKFPGQILLGLEATRASILPILLQFEFLRIVLLNPKTASDFRGMFRLSGAKSDPIDAYYLCELIRTHHHEFSIWEPHDPLTRQLNTCLEQRRQLVDLRVQIANTLQSALSSSFPQLLQLLHCQLTVPIAAHFLQRWPTLELAQAAGIKKLRAFFYKNNVRKVDKLEARLAAFMNTSSLLADPADRQPFGLYIQALARQLDQLHRSIHQYDQEIEALFQKHPNAKLLANLPGAGAQLKPRLAVTFGTHKNRFQSAEDITTYTGIAPIQRSSGKTRVTAARWVRPIFLHQTWIEHANCSIRRCNWAREFYHLKRESGKSHFQAIRALALKWIRILYACWLNDAPYDESTYLKSLENKSPRLWSRLQSGPTKAVNN